MKKIPIRQCNHKINFVSEHKIIILINYIKDQSCICYKNTFQVFLE